MGEWKIPAKVKVTAPPLPKHAERLYRFLWRRFTGGCSDLLFQADARLKNEMYAGVAPMKRETGECEYTLSVTENGFSLCGKNDLTLARAFTALLRFIRQRGQWKTDEAYVPCKELNFRSPISFRCIHFCFFPHTKLQFAENFIRLAGMCHFTHIIFEFWGTYRYKCFPALAWSKGGSYSRREIQPLIRDANALGMEVIPFFNHLGHSTQSRLVDGEHVVLGRYPEYAPLFEPTGWTWRIDNPAVLCIQRAVREELMDLCGVGSYFHIGLDEAYDFCGGDGGRDRDTLLARFIDEINAELRLCGRTAMIWGDQLLPTGAFGKEYVGFWNTKGGSIDAFLASVDKSVMVCDWQYDLFDGEGGVKSADFLREHGFTNIALCPWFSNANIDVLAQEAIEKQYGFILTTWNRTKPFLDSMMHTAFLFAPDEECREDFPAKNYLCAASLLRKCARNQRYGETLWRGDDYWG